MANIDDPVVVKFVAKADYAGNGGDNYNSYPDYGPTKGSGDIYSNSNTSHGTRYYNPYPDPSKHFRRNLRQFFMSTAIQK